MAEYEDREHYIPLRKQDLAELLCRDRQVKAEEREPLRQFCRLVSSVWHFEYLETLEQLKDAYAPFDPDSACKPLTPLDRVADHHVVVSRPRHSHRRPGAAVS